MESPLQKISRVQSTTWAYTESENPLSEDEFWIVPETQQRSSSNYDFWTGSDTETTPSDDDSWTRFDKDITSYPQPTLLNSPFAYETSASFEHYAYYSGGNVDLNQPMPFSNQMPGFYDMGMSGFNVAPLWFPFLAAPMQQQHHVLPKPPVVQAPMNHAQPVRDVSSKVESLFLHNKQFSSAFSNTVGRLWETLSSVHFYATADGLAEEIEKKVHHFEKLIDQGRIPNSGSMRQPYQLSEDDMKSAEALKNFVRALIPALMDYYKNNYKGQLRFEANDMEYSLSEKKYSVTEQFSITVNCYRRGAITARPFLTIDKP
jgi:hypothetical protein